MPWQWELQTESSERDLPIRRDTFPDFAASIRVPHLRLWDAVRFVWNLQKHVGFFNHRDFLTPNITDEKSVKRGVLVVLTLTNFHTFASTDDADDSFGPH